MTSLNLFKNYNYSLVFKCFDLTYILFRTLNLNCVLKYSGPIFFERIFVSTVVFCFGISTGINT